MRMMYFHQKKITLYNFLPTFCHSTLSGTSDFLAGTKKNKKKQQNISPTLITWNKRSFQKKIVIFYRKHISLDVKSRQFHNTLRDIISVHLKNRRSVLTGSNNGCSFRHSQIRSSFSSISNLFFCFLYR